ncbi:MAG: S-layer homology domain-containing protein [Ruminococcaceae bacterium]|nr:S-layer homology domain-containing protein [Oscillospiraceae bacterium]
MRKITKLLTLALAALMIMGAMPVSAAFADVSVDDAALYDAVELLTTLGVAKGTSETEFSPEALVTRQQMAAFVYRLMKAGRSSEGGVNTTPFADLEDSTFFNMISWANTAGIIKGTSATTFNPTGNITLQDAYVMVVRALGYEKDGALAYPFGYVDQAEALGLDENIPSTVDYTDNLTRGQVAIILANAFYADMNEKTVDYKWETTTVDGETLGAYVAYEKAETIANKIFGVVEETLVVEATAHYGYGASATAAENKDVDTLYGTRYDEDGVVVETAHEYEMADLKLEGSSDDYFMAEITLFVKKAKEAKDDEIIAAKSNLVKKTVTAADVEIARSTKTDKEYYVNEDKNDDKVMTGLVTLGGIKAYLDATLAPYSYTSLEVGGKAAVQFIDLTSGTYTEDYATFEYSNRASRANFEEVYISTADFTRDPDALTTAFEDEFTALYNGGLYEADVYDVNGDGYAEYIFVKDYKFIQLLDKKNTILPKADALANAAAINVKDIEATVEGVEFADKDYVLAYYNDDAAYIKVAEVVTPFEEKVTAKSDKTKSKVVTFANGVKVETFEAANKFAGSTYTIGDFAAGTVYTVYAKDGVVLYTDADAENATFDANANYAIVLENTVKTQNKVVDGEYKEVYFVKAVIDGAVKTVQLAETAKVFNKYNEDGTVADANLANATSQKIKTEDQADAIAAELEGKFSTFTKTSEGAFVFTALNFVDAKTVSGSDIATAFASTEDENAVYYGLRANGDERTATIKHFSGSIYEATAGDLTGISKFNVKDYSKLIIKSVEDDETVYTVYDATNLSKFDNTVFTDVKAVFVNNTKSSVENLGILFAEVTDFASTATKDYRIVVEETVIADEDGQEKNIYTVIDLTGNETPDVEVATEGDSFVVGDIVVLDKNGEIKNEAIVDTTYAENVLFAGAFAAYDDENKFLTIVDDANTYVLNADATILVYDEEDNSWFKAEDDALTVDEDEIAYEDLKDVTALTLFVIAEDNDENDEIKNVKTIVIVPTFA